jgi:hypothetical protein
VPRFDDALLLRFTLRGQRSAGEVRPLIGSDEVVHGLLERGHALLDRTARVAGKLFEHILFELLDLDLLIFVDLIVDVFLFFMLPLLWLFLVFPLFWFFLVFPLFRLFFDFVFFRLFLDLFYMFLDEFFFDLLLDSFLLGSGFRILGHNLLHA